MNLKAKVELKAKELKLTIRDVERLSNISSRLIEHWDTSMPSADKLARVSKTLNVSMEWLLDMEEPNSRTEESLDESEWLQLYRMMNPEGKVEALKRIREMTVIPHYTEDTSSTLASSNAAVA